MTTFIALPLTPLAELFERYVFGDWEFVRFLVVLITLDTVLGFICHWIAHDISSRAFGMIVRKLLVYSSVMVLGHVMSQFSVGGEPVDSFVWFRYFACSALGGDKHHREPGGHHAGPVPCVGHPAVERV